MVQEVLVAYKDPAMTGSTYDRIPNNAYFTIDTWVIDELIPRIPNTIRSIWEPACGAGHISTVLTNAGYIVTSTDLMNYGFGTPNVDFVKSPRLDYNIITNPPYERAICEKFVETAIGHIKGNGGFAAMLMRHEWDCAKSRKKFFKDEPTFYRKLTLTRRPKWFEDDKASPRFSYAWYLWWDAPHDGPKLDYGP